MESVGVGKRLRKERRIARMTQDTLATLMGYSTSMVRAVEQGREPASQAFRAKAANALGIEPERLTGAPYTKTLDEDGPLLGLADLRAILAEGNFVRAIEPPTRERLRKDLAKVEAALRNDKTRLALELLPNLIRGVYGAIREASEDSRRDDAYQMLCAAWLAAEEACCRLGYLSLTALILDRLDRDATMTSDPGYAVRSLMKRARLLMSHGSNQVAMTLVEQGLSMIDGHTEREQVLRGYGHLRGAIVAARSLDLDTAKLHIEEARSIAVPLGHESNIYGTFFGPGNVMAHEVDVELSAGDPGKAARIGWALKLPPDMPAPREGHHWQTTASAWLMTGRPDLAMEALYLARKVAPQQTRLHPDVREIYAGIAMAHNRRNDTVGAFGQWLGVPLV